MSATIYVTPEAMATLDVIRGLDYYDRCGLSDDPQTGDVSQKAGYYLKSDTKMQVAVLSIGADIALKLTPSDQATYTRHVSLPASLRGCLFQHAPRLPDGYAAIVKYWSGDTVSKKSSGAAYYQPSQNEYMVDLSVLETELDPETPSALGGMDDLLSEGVVVHLSGLGTLSLALQPDQFLEIQVPVYLPMLGLEQESVRSTKDYPLDASQRGETIFIKIDDIRRSPNPDAIWIDLLRWESLDYGFFY
ncbi:MAG: hypothetical protein P4L91_06475 [Burkholderiaceae bacterium]|nr:hypothetical protein [Burkholderiaceae bacterium]